MIAMGMRKMVMELELVSCWSLQFAQISPFTLFKVLSSAVAANAKMLHKQNKTSFIFNFRYVICLLVCCEHPSVTDPVNYFYHPPSLLLSGILPQVVFSSTLSPALPMGLLWSPCGDHLVVSTDTMIQVYSNNHRDSDSMIVEVWLLLHQPQNAGNRRQVTADAALQLQQLHRQPTGYPAGKYIQMHQPGW